MHVRLQANKTDHILPKLMEWTIFLKRAFGPVTVGQSTARSKIHKLYT